MEILLPVHPPPLPFRGEKKEKKQDPRPRSLTKSKTNNETWHKNKKIKKEKKKKQRRGSWKRRRGIKDGPGRIVVCTFVREKFVQGMLFRQREIWRRCIASRGPPGLQLRDNQPPATPTDDAHYLSPFCHPFNQVMIPTPTNNTPTMLR